MSYINAIELKGGMLPTITLQILSGDLAAIREGLEVKIQQGRGFFQKSQIIIDFTPLTGFLPDVLELLSIVHAAGMFPLGYYCTNEEHLRLLQGIGIPLISSPRGEARTVAASSEESQWLPPLLHAHPVRSGQQIYAQKRDLILTAQASNGSELLADGNIHVYGALRGRALCGVNGYGEARIFCQKFDAELVAIAGIYRLVDESLRHLINRAVQIRLVEEQLKIEPME